MMGLLFSRIEGEEMIADMDIASMPEYIVEEIMRSKKIRASRFYTSVSFLKSYAAWCVRNGFSDGSAGILHYVPDGLNETRIKMVSGELQLNAAMDQIFSPVECGEMDNLARAFLWMIYAGIHINDAETVRTDDVDLIRMSVRLRGREYSVSRISAPVFRFAVESNVIRIDHPQYKSRKRIDSPMLLRASKKNATANYLARWLRDRQQKSHDDGTTSYELTQTSVYWSGRFSDMYAAECAGVFPDFSVFVDEYMQSENMGRHRNGYRLKGRDTEDAYEINRRALRLAFLEEYSRWKLAFITI